MVREGVGIEIITGVYGQGTAEQNETVNRILGTNAAARFEVYFHWYNLLHELGHGVMWFYAKDRPHPVDEEMLVNQFAAAYWLHYGEAKKLAVLRETVDYAMTQFTRPAAEGVNVAEYARDKWGQDELYNFNNYGWFQMSCVADVLRHPITLPEALDKMGVANAAAQPRKELRYALCAENAVCILQEAVQILSAWGVALPPVRVTFDDDPNRHMCNIDM